MEQNRLQRVFDDMKLLPEEKAMIWKHIESQIEEPKEKAAFAMNRREMEPDRRFVTRIIRIVAILVLILGIGAGTAIIVNGLTDGRLADAFTKIWSVEKSSRKIMHETTDYHITLDTVYAPELIECSKSRVIFASTFGLLIYDRKQQQVVGTIDLQQIKCNYFNADTLRTRFLIEQDRLTIYNLSKRQVTGTSYVYDLGECEEKKNCGVTALQPIETNQASSLLDKMWKQQNSGKRIETFGEYSDIERTFQGQSYSEYSIRWKPDEKTRVSSCLVVTETGKMEDSIKEEYRIVLYHKNLETQKVTQEKLQIRTERKEKEESTGTTNGLLPKYQYQGEDLMERALVSCFENNLLLYEGHPYQGKYRSHSIIIETSDVILPIIDIVKVKEAGKRIKVYGTFRWEGYSLSGDTLYEALENGGSEGVAYLEKTDYGYEVQEIIYPRDGGLYRGDLVELCDGDEKLASKMDTGFKYKKIQKRALKKYVKQNGLKISYYKEFGWDPEKIG